MTFLNFLTQGQPQNTSTSTLTTSQVPQYLSDYLYNLMSGSYAAAQEEYQPYGGPRVAGFTPERLSAFDMSKEAATAYKPQMEAAGQTAGRASEISPTGVSDPYFDKAGTSLPSVIQSYMNPYEQNVVNRMGDMAQREITEKLMPGIGDQFIRAGQFGSTRQQELAQRGVRDISEGLTGQIGDYLAKGYTTAGQQAQEDLRRQASIGQAKGQLATNEMGALGTLAGVQSNLAQREQNLGIQGAAAMETVGMTKEAMNQRNLDLAYNDFVRQRDYPKDQLGFLSNIVRGLPSGGGTSTGSTTSSGQSYSASPLAQLASAGMGAASISKLLGY